MLQKAKIPEISFPLRETFFKNSNNDFKKNTSKSEIKMNKNYNNKQTALEKYHFQSQIKEKSNEEIQFEEELEKAIAESKLLYEFENQKEMKEIYEEIKKFEESLQEKDSNEEENQKKNEKKRKMDPKNNDENILPLKQIKNNEKPSNSNSVTESDNNK